MHLIFSKRNFRIPDSPGGPAGPGAPGGPGGPDTATVLALAPEKRDQNKILMMIVTTIK